MLGEAGSQPHVVDLLRRETEGNIFFIIEVIRALAEEVGQLEQIGLMTLPQQVFAGGMWRIIQRRLSHVSDFARPLLQLAAIMGREQDTRLLHTLAPGMDFDRWFLDCANAAILELVDTRWRFTHDKLREGVLDGLTLSERQHLHARVAMAMERLYGGAAERISALAYHWGMAENEAKEAVYTRLAGEQSVRSGAFREAINYLERTLELLNGADRTTEITVMHRLAEAHLGVGGYARAERLYRDSIELADSARLPLVQAEGLYRLGDIAYAQGKLDGARAHYLESRTIYEQAQNNAGIARVLNSLGNLAYDSGDPAAAKQLYQESLLLTRETGGQWNMAGARRSTITSTQAVAVVRDTREMKQLLDKLDEHVNAGDKRGVGATLYQLGEAAQQRSGIPEAREYLRKSAAAYRDINDYRGMMTAYRALSDLALNLDDRSDARKQLAFALRTAQQFLAQPARVNGDHASRDVQPDQDVGLILSALFSTARYFQTGGTAEHAVELLAFILYHPAVPEGLQDQAEDLAFKLESLVAPTVRNAMWERGKNRPLDVLLPEVLQAL
jgi:tetratricopeptide (TPR) repeat protein